MKLVGVNSSVDVNAEYMTAVSTLNGPTLYPSAYMVLTNKGYTKHYYAGTERVAARLGGGGLDALYHVIENDGELQTKADSLFDQCLEQVNHRVLHENDLDCIMHNDFAKEEFGHPIEGIPYQMKADVKFDHDQFKDMVNSMLDDINHGQEDEVYFYHSDHLGSASWITDFSGVAVQHIQYLPYGEPFVNQRTTGYDERFTFTGKERDSETGYSYFGARYYDSDLSGLFLSVDPMSDKYPSISPYAYCAWNPVIIVDPDGRDVWKVSEDGHVQKTSDKGGNKKQTVIYANGNTATFRGTKYHTVMSDLEDKKGESNAISSSYGGENMQSAYANVFKSMADNTNVEWIMERYSDNHYSLGTKHDQISSPSSSDLTGGKQNDKSLVALIHSHPMASGYTDPTSTASQISSMGYWYSKGIIAGDAYKKKRKVPRVSYYTYFPRTKQLWCVGIKRPAFIRNISSVSDFFYGTYNTR